MPIIKVYRNNRSFAVTIPMEIVNNQRIYAGSEFEATQEGSDRIILERVQLVRAAPTGSMWKMVKA